jgi:demethylmenaquinone methyltransferase / 2-methoxy-6-polyprenyl-1,4-benzoquinol methylase
VNLDKRKNNSPNQYKSQYVASLFNSIASTYDFLNHFLSGGIDFYWRNSALRLLGNPLPKSILDVATGTGDFAIAAVKHGFGKVYGIDIADRMLEIGKNKIHKKGLDEKIKLENGKAESLRFDDCYFDATIVAFGVRNFENLEKGLNEMYRVIKPDGKIVVLEFSKPKIFPFKQVYFFYFKRILPFIGKLISKHIDAYNYLPNTVLNFPEGKDFLDILEKIGFRDVTQHRLTFGIASAYVGVK